MPATVLAVDDSVTMRQVLEMTFAGEDVRVVTAEGVEAALAKARAETPSLVLLDVSLQGRSGYDACQTFKREMPNVRVVMMASKQNPFDAAKAQAAGADDHIEKPFDTQQVIDKIKSLLTAPRPSVRAAPRSAAPTPYRAPVVPQRPVGMPPRPAAQPTPAARPAMPARSAPVVPYPARPAAPAASQQPVPAPRAAPQPAAAPPPVAAPAATAAAALSASDSAFVQKLAEMGLSKDQIQGVLTLSHEVIERVVWEVVPVLAETMIKEEIKRLTAE